MTVIEQIIDELSDGQKSLTNPLLKTKILATRIENEELINWTNDELNGYKNDKVPLYRCGKASVICTIQQGYTINENVPLPLMVFKKELVDEMLKFRFEEGVTSLEVQETENKNGALEKVMGADMCAFLTKMALESGQKFAITSLRISVHVSQITQTLSVIRNKLLDFILLVEKSFPDLDELIKNKLIIQKNVNEKIEKIYHQTIITSGYGNTITAGKNNSVTSNINIQQGNLEDLKRELEKNKIPEDNIQEILEIVQNDKPDLDKHLFGKNTNEWIEKMISKTLNGSWQITTGAAGGLLVELIKHYYGWH